ncbi:MAG: LacI family DNA-binding transcriptional regulator [Planctomycetes bacterium]|nr:LacI family DNA-binding transcriptional regulator [Planctomycetota bacterium]
MSNSSEFDVFASDMLAVEGRSLRVSVRRLADDVRRHVISAGYSVGDRYLSVREVAERWRVSPVTAHRTLRVLSQEGILEVRGGAGTFIAASLRERSEALVQTVHLFVPSDRDMRERVTQSGLQTGIMDVLHETSIQLHFLPSQREIAYLDEVFGSPAGTRACVGSFLFRVRREVRLYFQKHRLPAVVVGHVESDVKLPSIDRNQRGIAHVVGRRLLARGCRRLGLLMCDSWNPGDDDLVAGFQEIAAEASLGGCGLQIRSMAQEPSLIRSTVTQLLSNPNPPTALVGRTDPITLGALDAVLAMGLRVPEDVAIINVGAGINRALQDAPVPITTISSCERELGREGTRLLLRVINGEQAPDSMVELPMTMIERESG